MRPPLCSDERRRLLLLARTALTEIVLYERLWEPPAHIGRLAEREGAFVTLFCRGRLRGCVGLAGADLPLGEAVLQAAVSAGRHDPRFSPVMREELPHIEIEISVLSEPQPIEPAAVEIGRHGLLIVHGKNRGLLLPQVASNRAWPAERFLEETCRKAGLAADAWRNSGTQILAFTAEVMLEKEFAAPSTDPAEGAGPPKAPQRFR